MGHSSCRELTYEDTLPHQPTPILPSRHGAADESTSSLFILPISETRSRARPTQIQAVTFRPSSWSAKSHIASIYILSGSQFLHTKLVYISPGWGGESAQTLGAVQLTTQSNILPVAFTACSKIAIQWPNTDVSGRFSCILPASVCHPRHVLR